MHKRLGMVQPYTLSQSETASLIQDLEDRHSKQIESARRRRDPLLVVRLDSSDPLSSLARSLEQRIFARELGSNHTPELMEKEYGPFESSSTFFLVFDASEMTVIGSSRGIFGTGKRPPKVFDLVCNSEICAEEVANENAGAKLTNDWIRDVHDIRETDGIIDFATLAVDLSLTKGRTGGVRPSILLYSAMVREAVFVRDDAFAVGETTSELLQFLERFVGIPAQRLSDLSPFPAFEGDEVLSVPFLFRWDEWVSAHEDEDNAKTRIGRDIYERAAGLHSEDQMIF